MTHDFTDLAAMMRHIDAVHEPTEANDLLIAGVAEIERLRDELAHRKRQQVIMFSCLENIRDGENFEGCKRAADIAIIAVKQITADMPGVPREATNDGQ